jgi:hypothetical protein
MIYAKIDSDGNVIKYPVRIRPLQPVLGNLVEVDTISRKPEKLNWNQSIWYDGIERVDDKYIMNYRIGELFAPNSQEKRERFQQVVRALRLKNIYMFDQELITQEKFDSNNLKLDMTNPEDEQTYNLIDELEF